MPMSSISPCDVPQRQSTGYVVRVAQSQSCGFHHREQCASAIEQPVLLAVLVAPCTTVTDCTGTTTAYTMTSSITAPRKLTWRFM